MSESGAGKIYDTVSVTIPPLGADELLGEKIAAAFADIAADGGGAVSPGENTLAAELAKLGLTAADVAEAWVCGEDEIARLINQPAAADSTRERTSLTRLSWAIIMGACNPASVAREVIFGLTGSGDERVKPQLSLETLAKYAGTTGGELQRFREGEEVFSGDALTRVCVALLLLDRELNFKRRRYFEFHGDEMRVITE
jgi:hypothetical protein